MHYLKLTTLCLAIWSSMTCRAQQICYSIADGSNVIYKFNLATGSIMSSQALSSCSSPEAGTLNLAGDTFWVMNADELHYIPVNSTLANTKVSGSNISAQQLSGSNGNLYISDFDAMSVDTSNNLWAGTSSSNPCLLAVIGRDGKVKEDYFGSGKDYLVVDNSSYGSLRFDAMAFDPLTNQLYANMNGLSQNYDYLFKINTSTGAMTFIKQFSQMSDIEGMAFDAKGDLYVTTGSNATNSSHDNKLWKVDLTSGYATEKFSVGGSDVETCDCVIGDPIPAVEITGTVYFDRDSNGTYGVADFEDNSVTVQLYDDVNNNGLYDNGTDIIMDSTETLADGSYHFKLVYTSGTEYYLVRVDTTSFPEGSDFTGDDVISVTVSQGNLTIDDVNFGYESLVLNAIEGYTYTDSDNDQYMDSWEGYVSGVTVFLYEDDNCNGTRDAGDDQLDMTTVGQDGKYVFLQTYKDGGSNVCFITQIDQNTLPTGSSLTTDNIETASFSSGGNADQNNNFGIWGGSLAALPVEWLRFDARQNGNDVQIEWATAMEDNNSHFEVQRSIDGDQWTTLSRIEGLGNTMSVTSYEMTDKYPVTGVNYYRIKQVDLDGIFDYSKTISVDFQAQFANTLTANPNPATNRIQLSWNEKLASPKIEFMDTRGQLVKQVLVTGNSDHAVIGDLDLKPGIYMVRVSSGNDWFVTRSIIR